MTTKLIHAAGLLGLTLAATACDLALLPEAGTYEGEGTPRLEVVIRADRMPDSQIAAVDLQIVDVMVHRVEDDTWVWLGGTTEPVELSLTDALAQGAVPLHAGHYDRVSLVVDEPRVASGGVWHAVALANDEIELDLDLSLVQDARLEIVFDVDASLVEVSGAWRFDPQVEVDTMAL